MEERKPERGKYAARFKRGVKVSIKSEKGTDTFLVKRKGPDTYEWKRLPRK